MATPAISEFKTFIPARDYTLSRQFYLDFGFELHWEARCHLCVFRDPSGNLWRVAGASES